MQVLFFLSVAFVCVWSPTVTAQESLKALLFVHSKAVLTVNVEASIVSDLDAKNNLSALFFGKTGEAFIFNYETDESVFIPSGVTDKTWYASSQCAEDYFGCLSGLAELYDIGIKNGLRFDPCDISDELSNKLAEGESKLSAEYSCPCKALGIALQISQLYGNYASTSLRGFSEVVGDVNTPIRGDFKWKVGLVLGLGFFFDHFDGGALALVQKNVHLDAAKMLNLPTGIDVLIYLLETLSCHFNLGEILGHFLNSEEHVLVLIDKLSGEIDSGFDGAIHTLVEIVKYNYGCSSWINVELQIRNYYNHLLSECDHDECYETKWKNAISDLAQTVFKLNSVSPCFNELAQLLNNIISDSWVEKGVDMSNISKIIFGITKESNIEEAVQSVSALLKTC